ncbi:MAG TPA: S41 family peptidase [Parafilimonas sp.]|nr:S41 family peptidase [Parafilimonas sp.]
MKTIFFLYLISIWCVKVQAQNQLTGSTKTEVINNLCQSLLDNYVFEDTAIDMKNSLLKNLANGLYDSITNPQEFAQRLTTDVRNVYDDKHLSIIFDPKMLENLADTSKLKQEEQRKENRVAYAQENFGFKKVEILNSNIGYMYFNRFYGFNEDSKERVNTVFSFLKYANALIIDVRNNGGGSPDMDKYISSFLLQPKTQLSSFYERRNDSTELNYTYQPDIPVSFALKPIYILVNRLTFSAAETFAYDLQHLHRATIIGETTGGGAHAVQSTNISNGFFGLIPYARAINPVTKTNWEATGVKPDVNALPDNAVDAATLMYYDYEIANLKDSNKIKKIQWARTMLDAKIHPYEIDTTILKNYTGKFGDEIFSYNAGALYVKGKKSRGSPSRLIPLSQTSFKQMDIDYYKFEFVKNAKGEISGVVITYDDGYTRTDQKEE